MIPTLAVLLADFLRREYYIFWLIIRYLSRLTEASH